MALQSAFDCILGKMKAIHDKKNHDYAKEASPFSNFEYASQVALIPVYKVFMTIIGIKMARLNELLDSGKTPNNESIQDTFIDLATYTAIMAAYFQNKEKVI